MAAPPAAGPNRANSWGYHEVSGVLRYAIDAKALPQLLEVLEQDLERLQPQELELLPDKRSQFRRTADTAEGPDVAAVDAWYRIGAVDSSDDAQLSSLARRVRARRPNLPHGA